MAFDTGGLIEWTSPPVCLPKYLLKVGRWPWGGGGGLWYTLVESCVSGSGPGTDSSSFINILTNQFNQMWSTSLPSTPCTLWPVTDLSILTTRGFAT